MALDMPLEERKERWNALMDAARVHNVDDWAVRFLDRLAPGSLDRSSTTRDILYLASVA
jgi:trehalose 6-phosphate synthase